MKSVFESIGGTYTQAGDYFIPDIALPEKTTERLENMAVCATVI